MTAEWNSEFHWSKFKEFCKLEIGSGGPDHHCTMAAEAMKRVKDDRYERVWMAGCYVGPYEINMGSVLWENWSWDTILELPDSFKSWIARTWPHWQIRRERRAARTPNKMYESMYSYALWTKRIVDEGIVDMTYDEIWRDAEQHLRYFGRYAIIKIMETLNRGQAINAPMYDIRPHGAWSPKRTLGWLFPGAHINEKSNSPETLAEVNKRVDWIIQNMALSLGRAPTYFEIEVLLCNYRQVLDERNGRYAGWSLDMDLEHFHNIRQNWNPKYPFAAERARLFPHEHLGEFHNWEGPRKHLCGYRGYFWSDLIYDYERTEDFSNPVRRR